MVEAIHDKRLNRGEWAEFYVMMRLLGEGRLYAADQFLRKNYESYLCVLKIIRQEYESQTLEYIVGENEVIVQAQESNTVLAVIPKEQFLLNAQNLFDGITQARGIAIPAPTDVCDFAKVIYVSKPKAPAVAALSRQFGGKNDIFIQVRDSQTSLVSVMGFSIKSKFGQNPTLFNAGSSSQFLYKLAGCNDEMMERFNSITDGNGRGWSICKTFLAENEITMTYDKTQNPIYDLNLMLVRESMAKILAWCVKDRLIDATNDFGVMETTKRMIAKNPLGVPMPELYYERAIKDFLMASFTGMTAGRPWDGREQVNGGYIVVMDNGEILCYHSNDRESFRDYLYRNTYFEYVSANKYKWSRIIKDGSDYLLSLNASIRFSTQTR